MFSIGQTLRVKFLGGREVKGILKSQDSGAVKGKDIMRLFRGCEFA